MKLPSKWTTTTFSGVIGTILMLAFQAIGEFQTSGSISQVTMQTIIMFVLGLAGIGGVVKVTKRKIDTETIPLIKKTEPTKNVETIQKELHALENHPLEKLKNKLGLASNTPTSKVIDELQRFSTKSLSTLIAVGLTKKDYELFGMDMPKELL